jgi:putative ABC transport system substrate-binding protein
VPIATEFLRQAEALAREINRTGLPAMYEYPAYVRAGGLMSIHAVTRDSMQKAAILLNQILRGAAAGDLPLERPKEIDFLINTEAAAKLKVPIQSGIIRRARTVP